MPINHLISAVSSQSQSGDLAAAASIIPNYIELHREWPDHDQTNFLTDMLVLEDFLTNDEEQQIIKEVDPYMQRLRYEFDHWDDVSGAAKFKIII